MLLYGGSHSFRDRHSYRGRALAHKIGLPGIYRLLQFLKPGPSDHLGVKFICKTAFMCKIFHFIELKIADQDGFANNKRDCR